MSRPKIIYVGHQESPEFAKPLRWLARQACISFAADLQSAAAVVIAEQDPPDLLIIGQVRPGEHSKRDFEMLRSVASLTPIVCVLGSHCESEGRTGKPWRGAARVYAHQFMARLGGQLERWAGHAATDWTLPFTATEEDRLLKTELAHELRLFARVAVVSHSRATAIALGDLLRSAECTMTTLSKEDSNDEVDIVIWDFPGDFSASRRSFARLVEQAPRAARIALVGFPRLEDQAMALACGAAAVVSKPFFIEDLLWQMRQCMITP